MVVVAAAGLLAACRPVGRAAAPTARPTTATTVANVERRGSSSSPGQPPPGSTAPTTASPPPPCRAPAIEVTFDVQPPTGVQPSDRDRALAVLTDLSARACSVDGFASIVAVSGGRAATVSLVHVDQPGPPARVDLVAGGSAFAGVEWTSMPSCPAESALYLAPPGEASTVPVDLDVPGGPQGPTRICRDGFELGPFETTAAGTVAFVDSVGAGLGSCAASALRGSWRLAAVGRAGTEHATLVLTDVRGAACDTGGYVALRLVDPAGRSLPAGVGRAPAASSASIELSRGQSVSAAVTFATAAAGSGAALTSCATASVTKVWPPGARAGLVVEGPGVAVCGKLGVSALVAGPG